MTIKEIANIIADEYNRPVDGLLIERIKRYIVVEYNLLMKQQIDKYRYDFQFRTQYIVKSLTKVDVLEGSNFTFGQYVLRTTNKIPTPARINRMQPFYFVGSVDGANSFIYTEPYLIKTATLLPVIDGAIRYYYKNNYLYIFNNLKLEEVLIDCAFSDLLINQNDSNQDSGIHYTADMEFPAPADMIARIIEIIPKKYMIYADTKDKVEGGHLDNN